MWGLGICAVSATSRRLPKWRWNSGMLKRANVHGSSATTKYGSPPAEDASAPADMDNSRVRPPPWTAPSLAGGGA
eukprot:COSAG01_NODE_2290_length_7984_cov_10.803424_5_plen_75_part_00